eukprot:197640-Alexandrium_andersonii.AAC.1
MPPEGAAGMLGPSGRAFAMTSCAISAAASKSRAVHLASRVRKVYMRSSQRCSCPGAAEREATTLE